MRVPGKRFISNPSIRGGDHDGRLKGGSPVTYAKLGVALHR